MRYTEYHCGVPVIKDKTLLPEALAKLAKYEDCEERIGENFRKCAEEWSKEMGKLIRGRQLTKNAYEESSIVARRYKRKMAKAMCEIYLKASKQLKKREFDDLSCYTIGLAKNINLVCGSIGFQSDRIKYLNNKLAELNKKG